MSPLTADAVRPALDGASVAGLMPALVGAAGRDWLPEPARSASAVVLLVLDGLGWSAVQEHGDDVPTLRGMEGGSITTVVPSTTSTALTSIATGLAPAQHGIVGYRMLVDDAVLNVLRWSWNAKGAPPDPFAVQRHTAFLGREVPTITKSEFRTTGFTQAHLRGGTFIGWHTPAALVEHATRSVASGAPVVYAYYPGVDSVAHEFGLRDAVYRRELRAADRIVADLLAALPATAALVVTSDHGQVHMERDAWIDLGSLGAMVYAMAGDGRFRDLYARKGQQRELVGAARELVGDAAWVWSRAELLADGVMGTGATGTIPGRIGDVILASRGEKAFIDPALPNEIQLRSAHGSLTADEMLVPLLAARGQAAS
jgi:hypothetical protein